uniref:SFRICE_021082 n=1 Tax=Spodoptera frugiperda TaxID=7108 RepID=A0A2H1W344_SPOFR
MDADCPNCQTALTNRVHQWRHPILAHTHMCGMWGGNRSTESKAGNAFVTPLVFRVSMGGGDCLPSVRVYYSRAHGTDVPPLTIAAHQCAPELCAPVTDSAHVCRRGVDNYTVKAFNAHRQYGVTAFMFSKRILAHARPPPRAHQVRGRWPRPPPARAANSP